LDHNSGRTTSQQTFIEKISYDWFGRHHVHKG